MNHICRIKGAYEIWLHCNFADFSRNDEMQKMTLKAVYVITKLKLEFFVYGSNHSICF